MGQRLFLITIFSLFMACGSYSSSDSGGSTTSYTLTQTTITGAFTSVSLNFTVAAPSYPSITIAELKAALVSAVSSIYCSGNTSFNYYTPTDATVDIANATGTLTATTTLTMPGATGCTLTLTTPSSSAGWTFQNSSGTATYEFTFSNN